MSETLKDFNRREINFQEPQVETIVPEHFREQYPTLLQFIKKYYEYLEVAAGRNNLQDVFYIRDPESTSEDFLDYLFFESLNGVGADFFKLPRITLKLVSQFIPVKGTVVSVPAFFRYIYGINAEQFYPKTQIFTVGESQIGAESLKFIQDSYFYQILSIQIKSPLGITQWRDVYKKYNHPAGFALFAETLFETTAENSTLTTALSVPDSAANQLILSDLTATAEMQAGTSSITGIDSDFFYLTDRLNSPGRFYVDRGIQAYQDSIGELSDAQKGEYPTIELVLNTDAPRFSENVNSPFNIAERFSDSSLQTMDEDIFAFYPDSGLDSA